MTSLASFPPDVLELITTHVDFVDLIKLYELCGNKTLTRKCIHLGGIRQLNMHSKAAMSLSKYSWSFFAFFPQLTVIRYGSECATPYDVELPKYPIWTLDLPPTMLEIWIRCRYPLDLFLRPVDDDDDPTIKAKFAQNGLISQSLRDRFPNLHTLQLCGISVWYGPEAYDNQKRLFSSLLPTTLTSLRIPFCRYAEMGAVFPDFMLPPVEVRKNLVSFEIDGYPTSLPAGLLFNKDKGALSAAFKKNHTASDNYSQDFVDLDEAASVFSSLQTLKLHRALYHESFELISRLPNLTSLDCRFHFSTQTEKLSVLRFPAKMTRVETMMPWDEKVIESSIALLPQLTHLDLHIETAGPTLPRLHIKVPKQLTSLNLGVGYGATAIWLHFLPHNSLVALTLPSSLFDVRLQGAEFMNVTSLSLPSLTPSHWNRAFPPALTSLRVPRQSCQLHRLLKLPKTLRHFSGMLILNRIHLKSLSKLTIWTADSVKDCVRLRTIPQVPLANFDVTFSMKSKLVTALQNGAITEYNPGNFGISLSQQFGKGFLARTLRVFISPEMISYLKVEELPPDLVELCVQDARWRLPAETKRETRQEHKRTSPLVWGLPESLHKPAYQLPPNLTKLTVTPRVVLVHPPGVETWRRFDDRIYSVFYPLLATAPLLQTVSMKLLSGISYEKAILRLPSTITDLTLLYPADYVNQLFPSPGDAPEPWLPSLKHFRVTHAKVDYRHWRTKLRTLHSFHAQTVHIARADIKRAESDFGVSPASNSSNDETRFVLQYLFPPRLRTCDIRLQLEAPPTNNP